MKTDSQQLFTEVNQLHGANVANAQKTAENAIKIGVVLHQIKETVGHGNFIPAMKENAPAISERCCNNYLRLATERLIEEKARLLIPDAKSATVADLPPTGNSLIRPISPISPILPENVIPADAYEQARQEVLNMSWLALPKKTEHSIVKNIRGKDLMELYRDYGIVRAKELKVYNPPKQLTPDEKIAAELADAEAILAAWERAGDVILLDLNSKTGTLASRLRPARVKECLRRAVTVTKALRTLAKRKLSPAEKKSETSVDSQPRAKLSPATRARLSAMARARWAKAKARSAYTSPLVPYVL